jgi:hypothetical protein
MLGVTTRGVTDVEGAPEEDRHAGRDRPEPRGLTNAEGFESP